MKTLRFGLQRALALNMVVATLFSGCVTVVNQDEVGVRDTLGVLSQTPSLAGLKLYLWPIWDLRTVPIRTINLEVRSDLPSREGLTIQSEISILYRVLPDAAPKVLANVGEGFEKIMILPVFRSSIADVTARFDAKDMHTNQRARIEDEVRKQMNTLLEPRGFVIEAVLLKEIRLPGGLAKSIEERLQAEQQAQRMIFVLQKEKQEAERKLIEARGTRDAQKTISEGLTRNILHFRAIEAFKSLAESPNAKVIVTSGKEPLLMNDITNQQ